MRQPVMSSETTGPIATSAPGAGAAFRRLAALNITLACVSLVAEARSIWAAPTATEATLAQGGLAAYMAIVLVLSGFRSTRLKLLYDFGFGFLVASFAVPLSLFPDGLAATIRQLDIGVDALLGVGLVVTAAY